MRPHDERQVDSLYVHNRFLMIIRIKEAGMNPVEITLQPGEQADIFDANPVDALRSLMELYESGETLEEEESEVELMIQLSGMVYNDLRSDE